MTIHYICAFVTETIHRSWIEHPDKHVEEKPFPYRHCQFSLNNRMLYTWRQ